MIPNLEPAPSHSLVHGAGAMLVFALPLLVPERDSLALLAWLTLLAAPFGALAARRFGRGGLALAAVASASLSWFALPAPAWDAWASTVAALTGLFCFGAAAGSLGRDPLAVAALLSLLGALLTCLPSAGGFLRGQPWPPDVAARLLDLSPLSLTAESARVDWMRHPFVYEPAGSASISPLQRSAWGALAGPLSFVVGCTLLLTVRFSAPRKTGPKGPAIH